MQKMVFEYIEYMEEMVCQSSLKKYSYIWHQMKDCMNRKSVLFYYIWNILWLL